PLAEASPLAATLPPVVPVIPTLILRAALAAAEPATIIHAVVSFVPCHRHRLLIWRGASRDSVLRCEVCKYYTPPPAPWPPRLRPASCPAGTREHDHEAHAGNGREAEPLDRVAQVGAFVELR